MKEYKADANLGACDKVFAGNESTSDMLTSQSQKVE